MMKEATNFGIKYLQTMPDGHQEYIMHKIIWRSRESAEKALEVLKDTVPCPMLVEIWDPDEAKCLQDCPGTGNLEAEEPLPESDIHKDIHHETYKSNPDGTVDIEIDGQKITDPEKQKEAKERLDHMFDDIMKGWPWFEQLNRRGIEPPTEQKPVQEPVRPDPLQVNRYTPWWGILDPFTGEPLSPRYKSEAGTHYSCEAGDGGKFSCEISSFATC